MFGNYFQMDTAFSPLAQPTGAGPDMGAMMTLLPAILQGLGGGQQQPQQPPMQLNPPNTQREFLQRPPQGFAQMLGPR